MKNPVGRSVLAVISVCLTLSLHAQEIRLKFHHMLPPVAPGHFAMTAPWVEKVEQDSGGRIKIDIYPSLHLGGQSPLLIDQVREAIT